MSDMDRELDVSELPEMQEAFAAISKEINGEYEQDEEDNEVQDASEAEGYEGEDQPESDDDQGENSDDVDQELEENPDNQEEALSEEENAQEYEDDQQRKSRKLRQYRQEKNELIAQREYLREENERLKRSLRDQEYKSKYSEGETIYNQLENAINLKKQALEEGDVEEIVRADINLIKAQNKVAELEEWIEEEKGRIDTAEEDVSSPQVAVNQHIMEQISHEWLKENPDLNPNSIYYDVNKASEVKGFIDYLDRYLVEQNMEDVYYTPQYFDQIDQYKQSLESAPKKSAYSGVAPVRHNASAASSKPSKPTITLTHQEKMMAQNMGITPEEWLKYKIEQYQNEGGNYA